ncbi:MAG: DUF4956 domain-containing protein [Cyclobacteriaceae bacterium]
MLTLDFLARLLIDLFTMFVLIRFIYYPTYRKWDNLFPFFVLNFLVFLLAFIIFKTKVFTSSFAGFGGLGLLAAFTLLRFRTDTITLKDMTYLFVVLTLGVINAMTSSSSLEVGGINAIILLVVFVVDGDKLIKNQKSKKIVIPDISYIKPQDHDKLIQHLAESTGLNVQKVSIETIDFRRQSATVRIYYF